MNKIIAVDFDGTMCVNKWPDIGEANEELLNYLREEKAHGTKLILWTNRSGTHLSNAVDWSRERGIEFDAVNDNLQESIDFFGENSRKIYATEFIDDRTSNRFRLPFTGNRYEGMSGWASREVEIACQRENPDWKPGMFDYGCYCYASALKAFLSLMDDGHSGSSFNFTKQILIRLMNHSPLTPIEDTDDVWRMSYHRDEDGGYDVYQCTRKGSFFKTVYSDGRVKYNDNDRYVCRDKDNLDYVYHGGVGSRIFEEMFPITSMPYVPDDRKYTVITSEWLYDRKHGDFDLVAIWEIIDPNGNHIEVNRFFAEGNDGFDEVDRDSFFNHYMNLVEKRQESEAMKHGQSNCEMAEE